MNLRSDPRTALRWLDQNEGFRDLAERARHLVRLQDDLVACSRHRGLVALGLQDGTLGVSTPGAALAARLRQTEPSLVAALQARGWAVQRIRFRPQRPDERAPAADFVPRRPIPAGALAGLAQLRASTDSEPLSRALAHLLRAQGRGR